MVADVPPLPEKDVQMGIKTITMPRKQPVHAWTLVAHDQDEKKDHQVDCTKEDDGYDPNPPKSTEKAGFIGELTTRLTPFLFGLKCYGVDMESGAFGKKRFALLILKFFVLLVTLFFVSVHWVEIFCSLKEDFLLYGSCLMNLVFTARITSGIVSHAVFFNRRKVIIKLIERLDEIGHTVRFEFEDKRKIFIHFASGCISIFLYCVLEVKYYKNPVIAPKLINASDTLQNYINIHKKTMDILDNIPMNFITFFVLFFDVLALSFFVAFAFRFYTVFHAAPFCKWLSNGSKHEIGVVMKRFRQHHNVICDVVEQVDAGFAPVVLIWYVYLTLSLCCWIRAFSTSAFESIGGAVIVSVSLLTTLIEFYMLSVSTSLINDEVTAHLDSIRMMCINEDLEFTSSMTALQDRISHLSYVTCVLASPVSLTGWGFFSVSKGFVLTVSSTVLTFTLVLYGV